MRRVWVAVLLLGLVAALCVGVIRAQSAVTDRLLEKMDEVEALYDEDDPQPCAEEAERLFAMFESETAWFSFFFNHHELIELQATLFSLPEMLRRGDPAECPAALQKCRRQLTLFRRQEWPLIENIW